ncbi:MAG: metal-dependent transcriptional regulator [Promethearchaeota archaeon]
MLENNLIREKENAVLDLLFYLKHPIKVGELKERLKVKHSTLNSVLKRLETQNLIKWEKYGPVTLTEQGLENASHLTQHHYILEEFFKNSLDIPEGLAHSEALRLAGAFSCEFIEAICNKLGIDPSILNEGFCSRN